MLMQENTCRVVTHSAQRHGPVPYASTGSLCDDTLVDVLKFRGSTHPEALVFTFRDDEGETTALTYGELDRRARVIAAAIGEHARPGDRALLVYPPGLDFVCGFFGCLYSGVLAVPTAYPRPRRPVPRLLWIAQDCMPAVVLTNSNTLRALEVAQSSPDLERARWIATDTIGGSAGERLSPRDVKPTDLAFLQYTSGSTSEPKGVMVSHANLTHNLKAICEGFDIERTGRHSQVSVFWLPAYHDMGLIGGILGPVYIGGHSILMSPASFLQQPLRWLRAISDYKAAASGGPNFAYELCVRRTTPQQRASLDLSSWQVAFCGAEPIEPETVEQFAETFAPQGFRPESFYPCYGLAECTLLAAGPLGPSRLTVKTVNRARLGKHRVVEVNADSSAAQRLVSCGQAPQGQRILIIDPSTGRCCAPNEVGEIWISGPSVAQGYWQRTDETKQTFRARVSPGDHRRYLRTGDLGFLCHGDVYVTGRLKEVIIIRGQNQYPQDLERTVQKAHPALRWGSGAAFSVEGSPEPKLVLVHEVDREHRACGFSDVVRRVRRDVTAQHGISPHAVVLIRQASLHKTTSGKTQRNLCRQAYESGTLKVLYQWTRSASDSNGHANRSRGPTPDGARHKWNGTAATETDRRMERIESWLLDWLVQRCGISRKEVDLEKPFAEYGVDSLAAVELGHELEEWLGITLTATVAWNYPTPRTLSHYLARETAGGALTNSTETNSIGD